jgi:hypothetical protein
MMLILKSFAELAVWTPAAVFPGITKHRIQMVSPLNKEWNSVCSLGFSHYFRRV